MYYSIVERTGTGSTQLVPVPPYLHKSHITLFVNGAPSLIYQWTNDSTISVVVPTGQLIRVVRRSSPGTLLTDYNNGTSLPGEILDLDSKQAFYLAQEAFDLAVLGGTVAGNTAGTAGGIELTTGGLLALLSGQITAVQLEGSLAAQVGLINAPASTVGSLSWYMQQESTARQAALTAEAQARVAALQTEALNRGAAIEVESQARQAADSSLSQQITTLTANLGATTAAVQTEVSARADADSALGHQIDTVTAAYHDADTNLLAAVTVTTDALAARAGVVESNYAIKVTARDDGLQAIAGISLNSTVAGDISQSQIIFQADKFAWVPGSNINATPQPLLEIGQVNGVNTYVFPSTHVGDRTLGARMFVDGSIETRMLKVVGGSGASLWTDTNFEDLSAWEVATWGTFPSQQVITDGVSGGTTMRSGATEQSARGVYRVPVSSSKRYRVSAYVRRSSTANGSLYIRLHAGNTKTNAAYQPVSLGGQLEGYGPGTTWTRVKAEWVPDVGITYAAPMVLLNYGGTAGWMEAQDIRIEEMLDSSLVVEEGLDADRINTRGLTIKDALGNVIFGASQNLDMSRITGAGAFAGISKLTGTNAATYIEAGAIQNAQIGNIIESTDFLTGVRGWRIDKSGTIEIQNAKVRGDITANNLEAATGSFKGSLTGATGTFSGTLSADAVNAVTTVNIADNAVTIPVFSQWSGNVGYASGGWTTLLTTPPANFQGAVVSVTAYIQGSASNESDQFGSFMSIVVRVVRDGGVEVASSTATVAGTSTLIALGRDTPAPGNHTYSVQFFSYGAFGNMYRAVVDVKGIRK